VLHRVPPASAAGGATEAEAEQLLRDAAKLHTGQPAGNLAKVVDWFRPHLFFDSGEKLRPVDVDSFLARRPGGESHEICDGRRFGDDNCEAIDGPAGLVGQLDEYLDLIGTARFFDEEPDRQRMYVHVRRSGNRLFLGYWWFFPSNVSPWRPEVTCLPGFTFADTTCFDHEADWEGVTVELRIEWPTELPDPYGLWNLTPKAVIYDFHGHPVRWRWSELSLRADPGSHATHPMVFVAKGSHASYPAACTADRCNQRLGGKGLGEGRFDGGSEWDYNAYRKCHPRPDGDGGAPPDPCLLPLPTTRDGRLGVLWNAYQGRWGAAVCVVVARACTQTEGPASPSRQTRFTRPRATNPGSRDELERFKREYDQPPDQKPRWPPEAWPPPDGAKRPTTPAVEGSSP
jgi:hypothetical protein